MYIVIVGGGKVGHQLAKMLSHGKHQIALVEKEPTICAEIAEELDNILVIEGDGCESHYLEDAGIKKADVVAAVTGDDEDNIVICQLAKEYFHVPRTVARVNDPKNEHVFDELGVDVPINSTAIIARIIEEETSLEDFINLMTFQKGKLTIVRVDLMDESPATNKRIEKIKLPPNSVIVSIIRGEEVIVPTGETKLQEGDDIIAVTTIENEQALLKVLLGEIDINE
jgi:trk system potassium uptake protein TrkA